MSLKIKVCYVVCYKNPNYVRTEVLVEALSRLKNVELTVIRNSLRGSLRYIEVPIKLLIARLKKQPDLFIVGFRGNEVFWLLYPAMIGKPKFFDEFVNFHNWFIHEHRKFSKNSFPAKLLDLYMRWLAGRCRLLLTDTPQHAQLASANYQLPVQKVASVPVGADEKIFHPIRTRKDNDRFEVFFFGNMLPLHGTEVMLGAINKLLSTSDGADYHFTLAGGRGSPKMLKLIADFIRHSPRPPSISHYDWVQYSELPKYIAKADLCLGGPFGDTGQARRVITGKTYQFIAMAKTTIVSDTGPHELFADKLDCLKVSLGDEMALASTIKWAKNNRHKLPDIGNAARELYLKHYSTDRISHQLGELINEAI